MWASVLLCTVAAAAAEVYFYDAVENVEDLASEYVDDEDEKQRQAVNPQLSRLQSRLVVICQRKASVRNRKVSLSAYSDVTKFEFNDVWTSAIFSRFDSANDFNAFLSNASCWESHIFYKTVTDFIYKNA